MEKQPTIAGGGARTAASGWNRYRGRRLADGDPVGAPAN